MVLPQNITVTVASTIVYNTQSALVRAHTPDNDWAILSRWSLGIWLLR